MYIFEDETNRPTKGYAGKGTECDYCDREAIESIGNTIVCDAHFKSEQPKTPCYICEGDKVLPILDENFETMGEISCPHCQQEPEDESCV